MCVLCHIMCSAIDKLFVCVCVYYKMSIFVEMYVCKILEDIFKNMPSVRVLLLLLCVCNKKISCSV